MTVVHGVLAAAMLLAIVVGLPLVLGAVAPLRLPDGMPDWSSALDSLTRPDDGGLLRAALTLVAWVAWACFVGCVLLEVVSVVRRKPTPRLPLLHLPQQGAASLVAAVVVLLGSTGAGLAASYAQSGAAAAPVRLPGVAMVASVTVAADPTPSHGHPQATHVERGGAAEPATDELPTVVVRRHDTLWGLAERHLSSGMRYREIVDLNRGHEQPDGRRLTDPHWIYPGWVLRLPADATGAGLTRPAKRHHAPAEGVDHGSQHAAEQLPPAATYVDRGPAGPVVATTERPTGHAGGGAPAADARPSIAATAASGIGVDVGDPAERAPLVALGLGAITVAGVIAEIGRQRHARQRIRRTGTRIGSPSPRGAVAERLLRAVPSESPARRVRAAMRLLAVGCAAAGRPVPKVEIVRVGPDAVRLLLAMDDPSPVAPFEHCGPRCWQWRPGNAAVPVGAVDGVDLPDPCPALVSVGADGPDLVLVNLEAAGSLHVLAEPDVAGMVLDALTVDLTTRTHEESLSLAVVTEAVDEPLLAGASVPNLTDEQAVQAIQARDLQVREVLHAAAVDDVAQARSAGVGEDAWLPQVIVGRDVTASAQPWSGSAVVTGGAGDGWQLRTDDGDTWRLDPGGVTVVPQRLDDDAMRSLHDLLDPRTHPVEPEPDGSVSEQRDRLRDLLARLDVPEVSDAAGGPRVLLLGAVEVQGADDDLIPGRVRRATELVTYLALHPGATRHAVDEAMWPGRRVSRSTRNPFVSRARQWLGRDDSGAAYLPLVADEGSYRLLPQVSCDWYDFVRLARQGLRDDDGVADLESALALVRGRPFLGVDPASYAWADDDVQGIVAAVVDVAHLLSVARLGAGAAADAARAAARGLVVEPASETLHRDVIRAAAARGDSAEVRRAVARMRQSFEALDLGDDLMPETLQLIRQLDRRPSDGRG
jgi:DNA-binding SARP family transcriptional activator